MNLFNLNCFDSNLKQTCSRESLIFVKKQSYLKSVAIYFHFKGIRIKRIGQKNRRSYLTLHKLSKGRVDYLDSLYSLHTQPRKFSR